MPKNIDISDKNKRGQNYLMLKLSFIFLSALLIACCHSRDKKSTRELGATKAVEQEPYQITLWHGGGFTGLASGFTLSSNGEVTHWQRFPGQADSILWKDTGNLAEIEKIRSQLEESGALEMKVEDTGNMTAGLSYETKEAVRRWTWKHTGSDDDIPESIRSWFKDTIDFCRTLQSNK